MVSYMINPIIKGFEDVIDYYGKANLNRLGDLVQAEQEIFKMAVNTVNHKVNPDVIDINLTLLDVIITMNPTTGRIIQQAKSIYMRFNDSMKPTTQNYHNLVWDEYIKLGGNYRVIVYGLIEYMCQIMEPTSISVCDIITNFNQRGPLRNECTLYKSGIAW